MGDGADVEFTRDRFLEPLGLDRLSPLLTRPEVRDAVFNLVVAHLGDIGVLDRLPHLAVGGNGLPMRVGSTRFVVSLSPPTKEEIGWLGAALLAVLQLDVPGSDLLLAAPVPELVKRFRKLRAEYGELSVVDSLGEGDPTAEGVAGRVHGNACREPDAGCRFMVESGVGATCGISLQQAQETLDHLVDVRGVLRRMNASAPLEYRVIL